MSPVVYRIVEVLAVGIAPFGAYGLGRAARTRRVLWLPLAAVLLFAVYLALRYRLTVPLFAATLLSAICAAGAWRRAGKAEGAS
jgi:hypothetical protein